MRRGGGIILSLILLPLLAAAGYFVMTRFQTSFAEYKSPIIEVALPEAQPSRPVIQQVVYIIVDGLRYDTSLGMPFLNQLREQGAYAVMHSTPPSYSQPSWTTLVTGARPDINGCPPLNAEYLDIQPIQMDHIFASLRRAGMTSALAGFNWWEKMIPQDLLLEGFYVPGEDDAADRAVVRKSLEFLKTVRPNLLLIHLDQIDHIGHLYGGESAEYRYAAYAVDEMIREIAAATDLGDSVLIVVSDHGHIKRGGHGGHDDVVLTQPFVMVGKGVIPGDLGDIDQTDVAPTIAALLGAAPPSATQGHILLDALEMTVEQQTEKLVSMAHQRIALGNPYLASIGAGELSEVAPGDAAVAQSSIEVQNYASAARLAGYAIDQVDSEMRLATEKSVLSARGYRRVFAILAIVLPLYFVYLKRSARVLFLSFAAVVSLLAFHAYFWWLGHVYSLSTIQALEPFLMDMAIGTAIGLGAGMLIVVARLWFEKERNWVDITLSAYGFAFFILYLIGIQLAVGYFYNGLTVKQHLPDFLAAFVQFIGMIQWTIVAAAGIVLPLIPLILNGALPRIVWKTVPVVRTWTRRLRKA
jgi:hypothetical protein